MIRSECPLCNKLKSKTLLHKSSHSIVKCSSCGHVYVSDPNINTESGYNPERDINSFKYRHVQILSLLSNYFKEKELVDIAEIGSGYGELAKLLNDKLKCNYVGFELNKERAKHSSRHGLNIKSEYFNLSHNAYDAIILDNVLEHVLSPNELIDIVSKSLKYKGIVIVIVPNIYDIRRFIPSWRKREYWQPTCHISYFSYRDLKKLFDFHGLDIAAFDLSSLDTKASMPLKVKTIFDNLGMHVGGLYTYGVNNTK